MKWFTHQALAVGVGYCLGMPVPALVTAWTGAILPDILDQQRANFARNRQKAFNQIHRGTTHWFGWWLILWLCSASSLTPPLLQSLLAGLAFGALMHVILDMCTVSGVPLIPWSRKHKISLKMCKTGSAGEYSFLAACTLAFIFFQYESVLHVLTKAGNTTFRL